MIIALLRVHADDAVSEIDWVCTCVWGLVRLGVEQGRARMAGLRMLVMTCDWEGPKVQKNQLR